MSSYNIVFPSGATHETIVFVHKTWRGREEELGFTIESIKICACRDS